jgi:protein O-GlcNAc transferase
MTVDVAPTDTLSLLASGRFDDALPRLREAFDAGHRDATATLNLAIAEDRAGDRVRAQRLMQIVADTFPDWDEPVLRLAESQRAAQDLGTAETTYRHVLTLNPDRPEALIALSGLLLLRGRTTDARDLLTHCCAVTPANGEAWHTLGLTLRACGELAAAHDAYRTAIRHDPTRLDSVIGSVDMAVAIDAADGEMQWLQQACTSDATNPTWHVGHGMLQERLGDRAGAIDALEVAFALRPEDPIILRLLGGLLARSSKVARTEVVLRQLAEQDPDNPQLLNDLAAALMRLHRHAEARTLLQGALEHHGPHISVLCNLANATACVGLQAEAVALAHRAIDVDPAAVLPRRTLCNTLPYLHGTTGKALLAAMRTCSDTLPRIPFPPLVNPHVANPLEANPRDPDRRLNVALLSGTLRSHPVGWLTVAGVENLDANSFAITCLVQNAALHDPIARRYRAISENWIDVDTRNDTALTAIARDLGIDVLIDLGGYGDASRMIACANRLAPVQIKWVGMQAHTSGLAEMDWFLTDRWETPAGFEAIYSERLLRLPDGYVCYSPPTYAPDVAPLPALSNGHVTFGCFNNIAKLTPQLIETWARILHRLPTARLVLKTHQLSHAETVASLQASFAAVGIAADRLEMRGSSGHRMFLGEYNDIDLVLDPFPYSGGLTTCEALWMGVPTITCPGEIFASRHSLSHLSNAGLADWAVASVEDYVEMAIARTQDLPALAALRADLRERVRRSPLCDAQRFGRNLGNALRSAWRDHYAL